MVFPIFPRVVEAFVQELLHSHFWTCCACIINRKMQICSWKCSVVHERHEAKRVPPKLPEENITSAKLQAEQNMGAIFKNIECERESKAGSADCTSAKLSPAKKRHFQTFKKIPCEVACVHHSYDSR